jgi:hypothetical protein
MGSQLSKFRAMVEEVQWTTRAVATKYVGSEEVRKSSMIEEGFA